VFFRVIPLLSDDCDDSVLVLTDNRWMRVVGGNISDKLNVNGTVDCARSSKGWIRVDRDAKGRFWNAVLVESDDIEGEKGESLGVVPIEGDKHAAWLVCEGNGLVVRTDGRFKVYDLLGEGGKGGNDKAVSSSLVWNVVSWIGTTVAGSDSTLTPVYESDGGMSSIDVWGDRWVGTTTDKGRAQIYEVLRSSGSNFSVLLRQRRNIKDLRILKYRPGTVRVLVTTEGRAWAVRVSDGIVSWTKGYGPQDGGEGVESTHDNREGSWDVEGNFTVNGEKLKDAWGGKREDSSVAEEEAVKLKQLSLVSGRQRAR